MNDRLLFRPELLEAVALSYPTIWLMMRKGTFPRSRQVGHRVAWLESEVVAWLEALPIKRLKGDADSVDKRPLKHKRKKPTSI